MTAHVYHLAEDAPMTEQAIEEQGEALWVAAFLRPDGLAFDCPSCGVNLEVRHESRDDVRGDHGADASQPGPVQDDPRHLEGAS